MKQNEKAQRFAQLHEHGMLILPNAWDAGSAVIIAAAVELPVSADVEGGYGPSPEDVAATVEAAIAAGVVGVNIEDSSAAGGPLFSFPRETTRAS